MTSVARTMVIVMALGMLALTALACAESSPAAVNDGIAATAPPEPTSAPTPEPTGTLPAPTPAATATPTTAATATRPADDGAASGSNPSAPVSVPNDQTVASSDDPTPTPEPPRAVPADMVEVPAPIESVDIFVAESFPPQYFVHVVSGLPSGCVEFYGYEESRSGNVITITVTNLEPAPSAMIACAAIYLTHEFSVPLGTDFEPGETYTVSVNDVTETIVAQ